MQNAPRSILYVNTFQDCRIEAMTLAGIRRYAAARGWAVEAAGAADVAPRKLPALLRARRPSLSNDAVAPSRQTFSHFRG